MNVSVESVNVAKPRSSMATAALVCGIVGIVIGLIPLFGIFAFALGAVAIVLGFVSASAQKKVGMKRGVARAGWLTGIAAIFFGIMGLVIVNNAINDFDDCLDQISAGQDCE